MPHDRSRQDCQSESSAPRVGEVCRLRGSSRGWGCLDPWDLDDGREPIGGISFLLKEKKVCFLKKQNPQMALSPNTSQNHPLKAPSCKGHFQATNKAACAACGVCGYGMTWQSLSLRVSHRISDTRRDRRPLTLSQNHPVVPLQTEGLKMCAEPSCPRNELLPQPSL